MPWFVFNGHPPHKASVRGPDDPTVVLGVGLWEKAAVHEVTADMAEWLRSSRAEINGKRYAIFTEVANAQGDPLPNPPTPPAIKRLMRARSTSSPRGART